MDQSEWMIYLYKDVLTGKRKKLLIYSLLNYDFVQYATVYEYMSILDFHRDWSYNCSGLPVFMDIVSAENFLKDYSVQVQEIKFWALFENFWHFFGSVSKYLMVSWRFLKHF